MKMKLEEAKQRISEIEGIHSKLSEEAEVVSSVGLENTYTYISLQFVRHFLRGLQSLCTFTSTTDVSLRPILSSPFEKWRHRPADRSIIFLFGVFRPQRSSPLPSISRNVLLRKMKNLMKSNQILMPKFYKKSRIWLFWMKNWKRRNKNLRRDASQC